MRRLIEALPPELYPRLTLQDHLQLAKEYGIGGVHLNARNPEIPAGFGGLISRSCHSFGEIASHPTEDYLFLSPIFDSISKTGYRAGYAPDELRKAFAQGIINPRVAALGGIRPEHLPRYRSTDSGERPFSGTSGRALRPENWCGACWKYENSTDKPAERTGIGPIKIL